MIANTLIFIPNRKFPLKKKKTTLPRSLCSEARCHMTSEVRGDPGYKHYT